MTRAQREAALIARQAGFGRVSDFIATQRKAERRQIAQAEIAQAERRQAERRAIDAAQVSNWIRRFDAARNGGLI